MAAPRPPYYLASLGDVYPGGLPVSGASVVGYAGDNAGTLEGGGPLYEGGPHEGQGGPVGHGPGQGREPGHGQGG